MIALPVWEDPIFWILALATFLVGYYLGLRDRSTEPPLDEKEIRE